MACHSSNSSLSSCLSPWLSRQSVARLDVKGGISIDSKRLHINRVLETDMGTGGCKSLFLGGGGV